MGRFRLSNRTMSQICVERLIMERKRWRQDPEYGFKATPRKINGQWDLMEWDCLIPGKKDTIWEGGEFKLKMTFPETYPSQPPVCKFDPPIFHVNVYRNGEICLSLISNG